MLKVLELNVEVLPTEKGFNVCFKGGLGNKTHDLLSEEEIKEVKGLVTKISKIVNDAITRDFEKELEKEIGKELEKAFEEAEEKFENFKKETEKELEELETPEEKMMYILDKLKETITKK